MPKTSAWHFGWSEVTFSLKTLCAAMLALGIALAFGFSKPYWAMATVYIVSQPLSGAVTSKALYRVGGTFLGALMTLVLVPKLINAPILLCLALAAWVGGCLFVSLLDRTPRSYLFMLAGYTAAIIGFASVNDPSSTFETAVARVQEITLGIICAAVISRLVFPRHVAPALTGRIETWLQDAAVWAQNILSGTAGGENPPNQARRLAADTLGLVALAAYLPYDTAGYQQTRRQLTVLEQHMVALIPLLSVVDDRINALLEDGREISCPLRTILNDLSAWVGAGRAGKEAEAQTLRTAIARLEFREKGRSDWHGLLIFNLCARLRNLIDVWEDCLVLRNAIANGNDRIPDHLAAAARYAGEPVLHLNRSVAWVSGLGAFIGILACCAFWIGTGWSGGVIFAQFTAVFCCIFCSFDNPLPVLRTHTWCLAGAIGISTLYQFFVFPAVDDFASLTLVLAPFLITGGIFMATPVWGFPSFALCSNFCLFVNLESRYNPDLASLINNNLAAIMAGIMSIIVITMSRAISAEEGVVHLLRAVWTDVARMAEQPETPATTAFVRRMVDRLGLLVPRLAALPPGSYLHSTDLLKDMRIGLNIADIQREQEGLSDRETKMYRHALAGLGGYFKEKLADVRTQPSLLLREGIDQSIVSLINPRDRSAAGTTLLHGLIGTRCCLFPQAAFSACAISEANAL